ncbi:glutamate racemase [Leuconostoc gelidum subsp. gasicomitatum]|uniref:glutamate racemase n=1 Tax=Leuconostoc gasicomitatum TaxID=115778 RepID=UPI001CC55123|nr:glutamate racemase [Leuconostoc gasicomitatum]MBZ5996151.1 glutamate racemase [Leuconostoc gasicomitatum]
MNKNNPIGMIDSGVGGLTVIKEAQKQLPNEQFIFIGDTARMPYGPRTTDEVIAYTFQMANYLITEKQIKMLVIACNTATACALTVLQKKLTIPVIGVIQPGAQAAQLATKNKTIGIIATDGTVNSKAYELQIHQYGADTKVLSQGEPDFVQLVEANKYQDHATRDIVMNHLAPFKAAGIDTLILGCTHFPLLEPFIREAVGQQITLIDSGRETIYAIKQCLNKLALNSDIKHNHDEDIYYTTSDSDDETFKVIATNWLARIHELDVRHLKIVDNGTLQHLEEISMPRLILASNNQHKIIEIEAILNDIGINLTVTPLNSLGDSVPEIIEDGTTFEENATKKAMTIAKIAPNDYILADDSGLSIDALNGEPGVYSARYAGDHDDQANNDKVLNKLEGITSREAQFTSVLVLVGPNKPKLVATGTVRGLITDQRYGDNGFGYDPLFLVPQFDKTFAQLTANEKNQVSHRGLALQELGKHLPEWLKGGV